MSEMQAIYLKDYKKPEFSIKDVALVFDLYEDETIVTNIMNIHKEDDNAKDIVLDSIDLELQELWLNDLKLDESRYTYADEKLTVLDVPTVFSLKIINKIWVTLNKFNHYWVNMKNFIIFCYP